MPKRLIFCRTPLSSSNIRRESRDGIEHVIISSFTLPPNVVMNRGLYPAEEVAKSFKTLERTLAPIEHPEVSGRYISATDPIAINKFYGGAWNENVEQIEDGRIKIDKVINVQEAMKSDKGKRLLDRINGMESGKDSRKIHTSVGVFVEADILDSPVVNADGEEYDWIARDMVFDHDAILLDSIGAATPEKGVGIGVNNERIDVEFVVNSFNEKGPDLPECQNHILTNADLSFDQIRNALSSMINENRNERDGHIYIIDIFDDYFIYETCQGEMFRSGYIIDAGAVKIQDARLPVERVIEYRVINEPNEENAMRDAIIAKLAELGIQVNSDIPDDALMAKYSEALTASEKGNDDETHIASVVANAVSAALKPVTEKLTELEGNLKSRSDSEVDQMVDLIVNSGSYKGLDADTLKAMGFDKLKSIAANCQSSYGVGYSLAVNKGNEAKTYKMPE